MATKTISKTSDREAQEKRLHTNLKRIFASGNEDAITAADTIFRLIMQRLKEAESLRSIPKG